MNQGTYVYGVIQANSPQEFGNIGIGENADVRTVAFKDIAAVISASPLVVYDSLAKEKIVKDLVIHQLVIEKVMERCTIVPAKFGTMVKTEEETIQFLEKGYDLLGKQLQKMEGKIELDVVASWDVQKILQTLFHTDLQIQKKQAEIASKGDQASVEDKISLGKLVERALKTKKAHYHQLLLQRLAKGTDDSCLHDVAGEEMIFNAAFLLAKDHEEAFQQAITLLDQELENSINFRVVGPLPLYSFSTILFEKIESHKLEEAKKLFGLNGEMTDKAIRDTYHHLAQQCHPDKQRGEDTTTFHHLHAAYRTLRNFIEHGPIHVEVYHWEQDLQSS